MEKLQTDDMRNMLDAVDDLRSVGINDIIPLPQIIVCGDQSSGKSSLLEALTGIPFPRDAGKLFSPLDSPWIFARFRTPCCIAASERSPRLQDHRRLTVLFPYRPLHSLCYPVRPSSRQGGFHLRQHHTWYESHL